MDEDPFWGSGSSGHPPLPGGEKITSSQMFWNQFWEHVSTYGLAFIVTAFLGGIIFGFALHVVQNVIPARKAKKEEKKKLEEELLDDGCAEIKSGDSVFRGKMNSTMIAALRRSVVQLEEPKRVLQGVMSDIPKGRESTEEYKEMDENSEEELDTFDEQPVKQMEKKPLLEEKEEQDSVTPTPDEPTEEKNDMLHKLGTLHGKLATAQLRARTRRMEMEMTQEERNTEADMRAKQLESIMNLMMKNKEKFGMSTDDVKEQLNLYNF